MDKKQNQDTRHEVKGTQKAAAGKVTASPAKKADTKHGKDVGSHQKDAAKTRKFV